MLNSISIQIWSEYLCNLNCSSSCDFWSVCSFYRTDRLDSHLFKDGETLIVHPLEPVALQEDTYDHLLEVIDHHEAIMAFYYMDESNKVILLQSLTEWYYFSIQ